ncbi:formate dehydrogenase accessory sulfurtransferase FdhD [Undibacterium sp. Rencai35W]|uniref:formate dehydrogenase accessory sulfurtransferase FdhD n=1 Tax=Undibacterium sp. Rencai35W TaxID=3413046 RepID=UPI003BF2663D
MHRDKMTQPDEMARASRRLRIERHKFSTTTSERTNDAIAEEIPVALIFNGISHAVMMATPMDLEDFAIGFSLAEQIVDRPDQIYDIECIQNAAALGIEVQITIASDCFVRLKDKRRSLSGKTGCGLCGLESLTALDLAAPFIGRDVQVGKLALAKAFEELQSKQPVNALTGALHAAAWSDLYGEIQIVREDVGRHNALDKLIGAMTADTRRQAREQSTTSLIATSLASRTGFAVMTSRASYELVQKAARAGIAILATISAPTTLAISIAERAGICLIGFVREQGFVVYSHPERLAG